MDSAKLILVLENRLKMEPSTLQNQNFGGIDFVWCPPGTFLMGSPEEEAGRSKEELLHQVTLTRGFWIGKYPVTQGQWLDVMGQNPSECRDAGLEAPIETVSWDDAQEFCRALSQRDDREYRLPTEAEWEYACRAESSSIWCFGYDEEKLGDYAWYDMNSDGQTHPVGQKAPNDWGIHDMHGNVFEWCQDMYGDYPEGSTTDPHGPDDRVFPVYRGGSAFNGARYCRSAFRWRFAHHTRTINLGFRVVVSPAP